MNDQTSQNNKNNRGKMSQKALEKELRTIWLNIKAGNITFDKEVECDIQEIHQLIEDAENNPTDSTSNEDVA